MKEEPLPGRGRVSSPALFRKRKGAGRWKRRFRGGTMKLDEKRPIGVCILCFFACERPRNGRLTYCHAGVVAMQLHILLK